MRVRTKICGITSLRDALNAVNCGADAIGFVFFEDSPRYINVEKAEEICQSLPPLVSVVGLFVNAQPEFIRSVCSKVPLSLLQFHGDEQEADCNIYRLPYIKAIRIQTDEDVLIAQKMFKSAQGLLVDTYKKGIPGGTGEIFDWSLLPNRSAGHLIKPLILAGGLSPDNISDAIQSVQPYAVDVSGGVELMPGVKDHEKVSRFIKGAQCEY